MNQIPFSHAIAAMVKKKTALLGQHNAFFMGCKVDDSWTKEALVDFAKLAMNQLAEERMEKLGAARDG